METSRTNAQYKRLQLVVQDRMNSICPMNFFRTTDTTDSTDTTIWKPPFKLRTVGNLTQNEACPVGHLTFCVWN